MDSPLLVSISGPPAAHIKPCKTFCRLLPTVCGGGKHCWGLPPTSPAPPASFSPLFLAPLHCSFTTKRPPYWPYASQFWPTWEVPFWICANLPKINSWIIQAQNYKGGMQGFCVVLVQVDGCQCCMFHAPELILFTK